MPTKTSPTLVKNESTEDLVDTQTGECVCCLDFLHEHVEVPDAKFYDIQVSTQQWANKDGTAARVRLQGGTAEFKRRGGEWTYMYNATVAVWKKLGVTEEPRTIYWRLRSWN